MYILYSFLLTLAAIGSAPYWLIRALRENKYIPNVRQRFGWKLLELPGVQRPLWIHAVSVGEVLAARVLFRALKSARPEVPIIVSTVTLTGQNLARAEMPEAALIFYFPFDWQFCVRRFLGRLHPRCVVLMETELWPNFLRQCQSQKIPVFLANGRISDKSHRRYRWILRLTRRMLSGISLACVQTAEDRMRFIRIGASGDLVQVTGNLKYDFPVPELSQFQPVLEPIRRALGLDSQIPVIVAGSTMKGEEILILEVFSRIRRELPAARLILAPRHPERFNEVAETIQSRDLPFRRRSKLNTSGDEVVPVLLLDSIGELRAVYSLATVAVIGGSFLAAGGHNPLEPAALGRAIVFGPGMSNFREISKCFVQENAARQCALENLQGVLLGLLRDERARRLLGQRAFDAYCRNQGAANRTARMLLSRLDRLP